METFDAINNRKSIRGYNDEQITEEELSAIVEVANKAPNAGPFHITVIQDKEFLTEINDKTKIKMLASKGFMKERASMPGYEPLYNAPTLIVVSTPEVPFAEINAACSITTMALAATDLGLGSCYVVSPIQTLVEPDVLLRLELPEGFVPISGLLVGYESDVKIQSPPRADVDNVNYIL
ncbi:MAG: nitroreductase family protein [Methanobrevibacter sp.]|uniref:nitroreductase family protein n=1 Tax=Methanobrevibacter sp. TaxID=66852 RepID=UPI0026DEF667|nr:nitroreductase family protein [Methanobrevibacter sp.]MDO5849336.1 nitroreductase family protein [Methanobrevibacter sp.]